MSFIHMTEQLKAPANNVCQLILAVVMTKNYRIGERHNLQFIQLKSKQRQFQKKLAYRGTYI